jgi:hypothetical protein
MVGVMTKSKLKENPFHIVSKENLVEVWLGEPNDAESDYILSIDKFWLPELIAKLKEVRL